MDRERKSRRHFTGREKVALLRRHLAERVAVSELCDEVGLQPTVFYRWLKEFFDNGAAALDTKATRRQLSQEQARIEALEASQQENEYNNSLATGKNGWIYNGTGMVSPQIVAYNPVTGEKHGIVPEAERPSAAGTGEVYNCVDWHAYGELETWPTTRSHCRW